MKSLTLNNFQNQELNDLLSKILRKHNKVNEALLNDLWLYTRELSEGISRELNQFKYAEDNFGVLLVKGYQICDSDIGQTPDSPVAENSSAVREEILLLLLSAVLGDAISWSSQRKGMLINDIIPIKGKEFEQLSTGSRALLEWHTEEAFHPYRPDHIGLLCLRNPDNIATTLGSIQDIRISDHTKSILFQPRFIFGLDGNFAASEDKMQEPTSVLFGDYHHPYIKIDPAFMQVLPDDAEAQEALDEIIAEFNKHLKEVILGPGDICFIDNYRAIHGRKPFEPRYDGKDRWLKRINIARDLRKSRDLRTSFNSRIILTD